MDNLRPFIVLIETIDLNISFENLFVMFFYYCVYHVYNTVYFGSIFRVLIEQFSSKAVGDII